MRDSELVLSVSAAEELHSHLIRDDDLERFAMAYCGKSENRFLATDVYPVEDEDLAQQAQGRCRPDHDVEVEHVNECANLGRHPLFIHSHPFAVDQTGFSSHDDEIMERTGNWLKPHFPDTEVLFGIFSQESVIAGRYDKGSDTVEEIPVHVVGDWKLDQQLNFRGGFEAGSQVDKEVYDRNIRAITEKGQRKISSTAVGVVGVGGLGSIIAEQLVRLGVENVIVVDPDVVEKSNLPRLQGATPEDVGRSKVEVICEHLLSINPEARVMPFESKAQDASDELSRCDVLMAGLDDMNGRMYLNEFSVRHLIPLIDSGVRIGKDDQSVTEMRGLIQLIAPGATSCFCCINRGDNQQAQMDMMADEDLEADVEDGYIDGSELAPEPAVVHLNGLISSKAVDEFVRMVTGIAEPDSLVEYKSFQNEFSSFNISCAEECSVCGQGDMLGRGNSLPDFPDLDGIEWEESSPASD